MGRFDAWLTDELSQKQEEPANDSTQAETTTPTEENTGSVSEAKPEHFISFSNLEASISSEGLIPLRRAASAEIKAQHVIRETVQPVDYQSSQSRNGQRVIFQYNYSARLARCPFKRADNSSWPRGGHYQPADEHQASQ